jgi:hypothetical protein
MKFWGNQPIDIQRSQKRFITRATDGPISFFNYTEVVMRSFLVSILLLAFAAFSYGQTLSSPSNNGTDLSAKVTFSWDKAAASTPSGFEIVYSTTTNGTDLPTGTTVPTAQSLVALGTANTSKGYVAYGGSYTGTTFSYNLDSIKSVVFVAGTKVYWKVRQKASGVWANWSSASNFTPGTPIVSVPDAEVDPGSVQVTWTPYGQTVNKLMFSLDGTNWTDTMDVTTSPATFTIPKGNGYSEAYVGIFNDETLVAQSDTFAVTQSDAEISVSADTFSVGTATDAVVWNSYGRTVTKIQFSDDNGATWSNPQDPGTSPSDFTFPAGGDRDSCLVGLFDSAGVANGTPMVTSELFFVGASSSEFTTVPTGTIAPGFHTIAWDNVAQVEIDKIKMSADSGATWTALSYTLTGDVRTAAAGTYSFNFLSPAAGIDYCMVGLVKAGETEPFVVSDAFEVSPGGATFTIPTMYTDPGAAMIVPVSIKNTQLVSGASGKIRAFDLKVKYNDNYMTVDVDTSDDSPILTLKDADDQAVSGWTVQSAKTETGTDDNSSYIIISAFAPSVSDALSECVLNINFTLDTTATHAGATKTLTIPQTPAVADEKALAIPSAAVEYTASANVKILTSITGNVQYFYAADDTVMYNLSGEDWVHYVDTNDVEGAAHVNSQIVGVGAPEGRAAGVYKIVQVEAGNAIHYAPSYDAWPKDMLSDPDDQETVDFTGVIDATDAAAAFAVTFDDPDSAVYSTRQRIAADVNEDGVVNSIDALSIMDINNGAAWYTNNPDLGLNRWAFYTTESVESQDAETYSSDVRDALVPEIEATLASGEVFTGKNFLGVLRGDVNFSFPLLSAPADRTLNKSGVAPVICAVPELMQAKAGDTVYVPVDVQLNGKSLMAFSASVKVDKGMFSSFAGVKEGPAFPAKKGWVIVSNYSPKTGLLTLSTTDLAGTRDAITKEGTILYLKFMVSKEAKRGSVSSISFPKLSLSDKELNTLSTSSTFGKIEVTRLGNAVVTEYALSQNYPNPFNPSTTIEFAVPTSSNVSIEVYNILGQKVASLFNGYKSVGNHQVEWNASSFGSGVYFYKISAVSERGDKFQSVKKLMLMK